MSFEDDSDLTSLSSDEETPPYDLRTRRQSTVPFRGLRPPRTVQYTVQSLYNQIKQEVIDLNPEYQRDVVWREEKQIALIESLFSNYYIPPIVFCVYTTPEGEERRTCIDGKQRLTSFLRFMNGAIPYKDPISHHKYWYSKPKSKSFKLLEANLKSRFDNKQIVCVEYDDITPEQEREIFQRVQMGVSLTPAERMGALNGAYATMIRDAQAKINSQDGFSGRLNWDNARGRDFQTIAQVLYAIDEKKEPTLVRLEKYMAAHIQDDVPVELAKSIQVIINTLCRLVRDSNLSGPLTQSRHGRLSPVEFVMAAYLIHVHHKKFSMEELSDAIGKMRDDVRTKHQEIRFNRVVYLHLQNYVDKQVGKLILKNSRSDIGGWAASGSATKVPSTAVASRKRKTCASDSDSDDDTPLMNAQKNRKRVVLDEDEGEGVIVKVPPKKPLSILRPSLSDKILSTASKAVTTVKRANTKAQGQPTLTKPSAPLQTTPPLPKTIAKPRLSTNSTKQAGSQMAIPSVKPTLTTQATKSSVTGSREAGNPPPLFIPSPAPKASRSAATVQAPPARTIQFSRKLPAAKIPRHRVPPINTTLGDPELPPAKNESSITTPASGNPDGPPPTAKIDTSSALATSTISDGGLFGGTNNSNQNSVGLPAQIIEHRRTQPPHSQLRPNDASKAPGSAQSQSSSSAQAEKVDRGNVVATSSRPPQCSITPAPPLTLPSIAPAATPRPPPTPNAHPNSAALSSSEKQIATPDALPAPLPSDSFASNDFCNHCNQSRTSAPTSAPIPPLSIVTHTLLPQQLNSAPSPTSSFGSSAPLLPPSSHHEPTTYTANERLKRKATEVCDPVNEEDRHWRPEGESYARERARAWLGNRPRY